MAPELSRSAPDALLRPFEGRQLRFRPALEEDIDELVVLIESAYRGDSARTGWTTEADILDGQRTDAAGVGQVIATAGSQMLLALDATDGHLLACCQLARRPDGGAYFGMFAVRPGLHGGGIGGQVMAEAERLAAGWGAGTISLSVLGPRAELIAWYERRGYVRTGATEPFPYGDERYGRPLVPDLHFVLLEKALTS